MVLLQYRKRYELLQLAEEYNVEYVEIDMLQYRKRYELLQLEKDSTTLKENDRYNTASGMSCCNSMISLNGLIMAGLQYRKRYELLQQRCLGGLDFTGLKWCFGTVFALLEDILHFIPLIPKHLTFAFATNPVRVRLQGYFFVVVPSQR